MMQGRLLLKSRLFYCLSGAGPRRAVFVEKKG